MTIPCSNILENYEINIVKPEEISQSHFCLLKFENNILKNDIWSFWYQKYINSKTIKELADL